jgi:hypothetical protein
MAVIVTYPSGRKIVSDKQGTTEYNERGVPVIRLYKNSKSGRKTGRKYVTEDELTRSERLSVSASETAAPGIAQQQKDDNAIKTRQQALNSQETANNDEIILGVHDEETKTSRLGTPLERARLGLYSVDDNKPTNNVVNAPKTRNTEYFLVNGPKNTGASIITTKKTTIPQINTSKEPIQTKGFGGVGNALYEDFGSPITGVSKVALSNVGFKAYGNPLKEAINIFKSKEERAKIRDLALDKDVQTAGVVGAGIGAVVLTKGKIIPVIQAVGVAETGLRARYAYDNPNAYTITKASTSAVGTGLFDKVPSFINSKYVSLGSEKVPAEIVFSSQVLKEGKKFPMGSPETTVSEILNTKNNGKYFVQTSSPQKISGNTIGLGGESSASLKQDPGIYVTPLGEGSPRFLRIEDEPLVGGYSFNPLAKSKTPTVTSFAVENVVKYPSSVIDEKGFSGVLDFQKQNVGLGNVYVTKRSTIGNTWEKEGVIGVGEQFFYKPQTFLGKIKGFDKYTTYKGRNVALRDAELVLGKNDGVVFSEGRVFSGSKLLSEQSSFSSSLNSNIKSVPYVSVGGVDSVPKSAFSSSSSVLGGSSQQYISSAKSSSKRSFSSSSSVLGGSSQQYISSAKSSGLFSSSSVSSQPKNMVGSASSAFSSDHAISLPTILSLNKSSQYSRVINKKNYGVRLPLASSKSVGRKKYDNSFNVYVRRRKNWLFAGSTTGEQEALNLGMFKTKHSAAASFRIPELGGKTLKEYYNKGDIYIQKPSFRIGTMGEKIDITYKGIASQRKKALI